MAPARSGGNCDSTRAIVCGRSSPSSSESCSSAASRRKLKGGASPSAGAAGEEGEADKNVCSTGPASGNVGPTDRFLLAVDAEA